MSKLEQWKVDHRRDVAFGAYYQPLEEAIEAGEPTWVRNFDSEQTGIYRGFYKDAELVGLVREQPGRNFLIYLMSDGEPVVVATRAELSEAMAVLEPQD